MTVRKRAQNLAWSAPHGCGIAAHLQPVFDGPADVAGVGEHIVVPGLADGEVWCELGAVLTGPGIDGAEQRSVRVEDVLVAQLPNGLQIFKRDKDVDGVSGGVNSRLNGAS